MAEFKPDFSQVIKNLQQLKSVQGNQSVSIRTAASKTDLQKISRDLGRTLQSNLSDTKQDIDQSISNIEQTQQRQNQRIATQGTTLERILSNQADIKKSLKDITLAIRSLPIQTPEEKEKDNRNLFQKFLDFFGGGRGRRKVGIGRVIAGAGLATAAGISAYNTDAEANKDLGAQNFNPNLPGVLPVQPPGSTVGSESGGGTSGGATSGGSTGGGNSGNGGSSSKFTGSQKEFYDKMYKAVLDAAKSKGVPNPEVIARLGAIQASLESGYGKRMVGNNAFGIKAKPGTEGVNAGTQEFVNGRMVNTRQSFRKYNDVTESATDYVQFLLENSRYRGVLAAKTIDEAIAAQARTGYATDPNYGAKLASINRKFGEQQQNTETSQSPSSSTESTPTSQPGSSGSSPGGAPVSSGGLSPGGNVRPTESSQGGALVGGGEISPGASIGPSQESAGESASGAGEKAAEPDGSPEGKREKGGGNVIQAQGGAAIRKLPISSRLLGVLQQAATQAGVDVTVTSGGQPPYPQGPRTGSTRHDRGDAADIDLSIGGRKLTDANPEDVKIKRKFIQAATATAAGATGIGAGYMGPTKIHVGFGTPATWGGASWLSGITPGQGGGGGSDGGGGISPGGNARPTQSSSGGAFVGGGSAMGGRGPQSMLGGASVGGCGPQSMFGGAGAMPMGAGEAMEGGQGVGNTLQQIGGIASMFGGGKFGSILGAVGGLFSLFEGQGAQQTSQRVSKPMMGPMTAEQSNLSGTVINTRPRRTDGVITPRVRGSNLTPTNTESQTGQRLVASNNQDTSRILEEDALREKTNRESSQASNTAESSADEQSSPMMTAGTYNSRDPEPSAGRDSIYGEMKTIKELASIYYGAGLSTPTNNQYI